MLLIRRSKYLAIIIAVLLFSCAETQEQGKTEQDEYNPMSFELVFKDKEWKEIEEDREKAIKNKVLLSGETSWVKGELKFEGKTIPVKARLKGDWTDHLKGDKWSFRVKVKGEEYVLGMKEFSFQAPETRGFLHEWVYHKLLEKEDILATKYEFCKLSINGVDKGVFALEEHFTKLLLERQKRREGPIVKYEEDPLWESRIVNNGSTVGGVAFAESAPTGVFSRKKTKSSPVLSGQYKNAKSLMYQNQYRKASASELYDVERLARYLAILDITRSYHGWYYHNQRWYYNGIIGKLEPIGFDGYIKKREEFFESRSCLGCIDEEGSNPFLYSSLSIEAFRDSLFVDRYFYYMEDHFTEEYLLKFYEEISGELSNYESLLSEDYWGYSFDKDKFVSNLATIKKNSLIRDQRKANKEFKFKPQEIPKKENPAVPVNNATVVAYDKGDETIKVMNVHFNEVTILGVGNNEEEITGKQLKMDAFKYRNQPVWLTYDNLSKANKIFYSVDYIDSVFYSDIVPEEAPEELTPVQELQRKPLHYICKISENKVLIEKGEYEVSDDIIILSGNEVNIEKGVKINMINGAKFISYSPVFATGTSDDMIHVYSSDSSANGFTILQANKKSKLEYVRFENFNTLSYKGWQLTGAVSFYESNVELYGCEFISNHCEDGLNIIRSQFKVENCKFERTFSDAFDGDFCLGDVINSTYTDIGNDAIDFSGSEIVVTGCEMTNVGDKGISIGENSSVNASNTNITNAVLGISAKDLSKGEISNVNLTNCEYGFAIFQKKPEFGPASAVCEKVEFNNVGTPYILGLDSRISFDGKESKGEKKIDIDALFY